MLSLYTMEDKLWELPGFEQGVDFTDGASNNIIFANDPSLIVGTELQGSGRFPDSIPGVRIPTLQRYVEALILLALREPKAFSTCAWVSELVYVVHLVKLDRLGHSAFRQFCDRVLKGSDGLKIMIQQAQEALGPRNYAKIHTGMTCKESELLGMLVCKLKYLGKLDLAEDLSERSQHTFPSSIRFHLGSHGPLSYNFSTKQ